MAPKRYPTNMKATQKIINATRSSAKERIVGVSADTNGLLHSLILKRGYEIVQVHKGCSHVYVYACKNEDLKESKMSLKCVHISV